MGTLDGVAGKGAVDDVLQSTWEDWTRAQTSHLMIKRGSRAVMVVVVVVEQFSAFVKA